ncbi:putative serine palmitoyltransferase small subunit B-like [Scophthalmus maximus]|uniref:Serine palmitoyltransferase small subunit B n=1 Tax=Scophthalmus maximus TaxID=52904 RepID=A0A2U9B4P6_SCOMX|nr:putative serine palmitoyltransferase small subunit B-like [Scophthalmus maximus]
MPPLLRQRRCRGAVPGCSGSVAGRGCDTRFRKFRDGAQSSGLSVAEISVQAQTSTPAAASGARGRLSFRCVKAHTGPCATVLLAGHCCSACEPGGSMNFKNLREYLAWLYYQYLLITGIYVLEPWEKSLFNSILFSAIAMVIYTSYVFVPIHVLLALEFFSGIFGGQPESTMTLIN